MQTNNWQLSDHLVIRQYVLFNRVGVRRRNSYWSRQERGEDWLGESLRVVGTGFWVEVGKGQLVRGQAGRTCILVPFLRQKRKFRLRRFRVLQPQRVNAAPTVSCRDSTGWGSNCEYSVFRS